MPGVDPPSTNSYHEGPWLVHSRALVRGDLGTVSVRELDPNPKYTLVCALIGNGSGN